MPAGGGLGIEPVAADGNDPSLQFGWRPVDLDTNRSYGCEIATNADHPLTVTIEQGPYHRVLQGTGSVAVVAIPVAAAGVRGKLIACDTTTGATAEFTWQWPTGTARDASSRATPWAMISNLAKRIAGLTSATGQSRSSSATTLDGLVVSGGSAFDGEWHYLGPFEPWCMRITENVGICVVTNAPNVYGPGDTMLYIDSKSEDSFVGRGIYTDGKFREVRGTLLAPDRLILNLLIKQHAEDGVILYRR